MTTIDNRPEAVSSALAEVADDAGRAIQGVASWATSADHKRLGRAFMVSSLLMGVGILVVGVLLGVERMNPDDALLRSDSVGQLFSLHRVGMLYLVVTPLLLGLGLAIAPLQVGSRSLSFGRAAALGFWTWLAGSVLVVAAFVGNGGPGGGDADMVELFLMGLALALIGLVAASGSLVTTLLTSRAPGMRLDRMPYLAWSSLVGGLAALLVLPVVVGVLVLLSVDLHYGGVVFDGSAGIVDWMGWATTQPASLIAVVPALGALADVVVTATGRRHPLRGGVLVGIAVFATAMLGAVTQVDHVLPWSGSSAGDRIADLLPFALFNLLPILGALIVIAMAAMALRAGRPRLTAGFAFCLTGGLVILLGAASQALAPVLDMQLTGTTYEEGSFVAVTCGGVLVALGALAHWGPKLWGRRIADKQILPLAAVGFVGAVVSALALMVAGFQGQPATTAGGFDYELSPQLLNIVSLAGQVLVVLAVVAFAVAAIRSFTSGEAAGDDPWDGQTLEWATSSPPPADNFTEVHTVSSGEPLLDLKPVRSDA